MKCILAIDQGTSSTRAMLYSINGQLIATSQYLISQYYPETGWVEHCPEEIWAKTLQAMQDLIAQHKTANIVAAGLTNQRETTVIWDKLTGKCLHRAIVWQDTRTQEFCQNNKDANDFIRQKTGLLLNPYFSASKLQWLIEHIPDAKELATSNRLAFGTIDSFLLWRLTKGRAHKTDVTNASRTLLYNIHQQSWDKDLLNFFNIPENILPEVMGNDAFFGFIDEEFSAKPIPITGMAGDQQAALIGQLCFNSGMVKATYGTGGFLLMNTGEKNLLSQHHLLTTVAYKIREKLNYALEGSLYHAGTSIKWLKDELGIITTSSESERLAASLQNNDGVYFIPSFTGLGAPYWHNEAGAIIIGLKPTSTKAHLARAALESVSYLTYGILSCMQKDSETSLHSIRVDGGMAKNNWFLQRLANQCQVVVERPADIETTARGAALLAALGAEEFSSLDKLTNFWHCDRFFMPEAEHDSYQQDLQGWELAIGRYCSAEDTDHA